MLWWLSSCSDAPADLRPVTVEPTSTSTSGSPSSTGSTQTSEPPTGPVALNEFLAANLTGLRDDLGEHSDWIELYGAGPADVALAGYAITDDLSDPAKQPLDPSLVVPSHGFLLLYASGDATAGPQHLGFALAEEGGEIGLYQDGQPVDLLRYDPQASDWSAARMPDGDGAWSIDETPTPGASNE